MTTAVFQEQWRRSKSSAFELTGNSTAGRVVDVDLWGSVTPIYANANLSIYSGRTCNAKCFFCVEELRPASRGRELSAQKIVLKDDEIYFSNLERTLTALAALSPTASVTGGEPSKDLRLPRILTTLSDYNMRKRTMTTNGSGLLDTVENRRVIDWIVGTGVKHLNISRAHPDYDKNAQLMRLTEGLNDKQLTECVGTAADGGTRVRLSCVLLQGEIDSLEGIILYLNYAKGLGVDNVIFRQLMKTDSQSHADNFVVKYSDSHRVALEPLLDQISKDGRFTLVRQIVGYYYYVEVWKYADMDVVFEEADLAQLEITKGLMPGIVHELVYHPNGKLSSTWQPWDGVLGPPELSYQSVAPPGSADHSESYCNNTKVLQ